MMDDSGSGPIGADRRRPLRYAGTCRRCGASLPAGADAIYEPPTRTLRCVECAGSGTQDLRPPSPEIDVAGSSARREYERRKAKDEARRRERWDRFGGLAVALATERPTTRSWDRGAGGEEWLGARLDSLTSAAVAVLHDRRIPGTRANIDHIVITPTGVWVIDAKRLQGRLRLNVGGGIGRHRRERLMVGRRDWSTLVDGVLWQTASVRDVVGDTPVHPVLCFIEAEWPLLRQSFITRGVKVLAPRRLTRLLTADQPGIVDVPAVREQIHRRFPPA